MRRPDVKICNKPHNEEALKKDKYKPVWDESVNKTSVVLVAIKCSATF
jgi:hypothetical protein